MVTITAVTLQNFRGFAKLEDLRLAPLTFLVGPNSSGKSSVADAVLFMAQSGFLSLGAMNPIWDGALVDLGSFKDTVFRHEATRGIEVRVRLEGVPVGPQRSGASKSEIGVEISAHVKTAKDAPEGRFHRLSVREPGTDHGADWVRRGGAFHAQAGKMKMSFDAAAPQPWLKPATVLGDLLAAREFDISKGRRKTTPLAELMKGSSLSRIEASVQRVSSGRNPPQRSYQRDGGRAPERSRRLLDGIDATALETGRSPDQERLRGALVEGLLALRIADDLEVARLSDYHTAVRLQDSLTGVSSNVADFGYGASQVIPVLEGSAAPGPGPLFIEQPEIHLHPRAQGELAQILCDASRRRQMIVETHSEHMINRARRLVAEGKMKARDVVIQYIDRDREGSHAFTIELDEAGDFTRDWPDGFFDERYHETMRIAEAQAHRAAE